MRAHAEARPLAPPEGLLTGLLAVSMSWATMQTIASADWAPRVDMAPLLAVAGGLVGMLAARSRLRGVVGLAVGALIGLELLCILAAAGLPSGTWQGRLSQLAAEVGKWALAALSRGATHDPLIFALAMGWVGWTIGFFSSWLVFRLQHAWWPVIANGAIGLIHLSYASLDQVPLFLCSVILGVLLVASLENHLRGAMWRAYGLPVQGRAALWSVLGAGALAGLALAIGWRLPPVEAPPEVLGQWRETTEPLRSARVDTDGLFGGGRGQSRPGSDLRFAGALAPRGSFELGTEPLLKIAAPRPLYWRAATYDRYDGFSVTAQAPVERTIRPGRPLELDPAGVRGRLPVEQRVMVLAAQSATLVAADAPREMGREVVVGTRDVPWDVAGTRLPQPLLRGDVYRVLSLVPVPTVDELRTATSRWQERRAQGADAPGPAWLRRYRELPPLLPGRVRELAMQLTADSRTQVDATLAIEAHLRSLTYSTHVPTPPPFRDWADYLLFESKTGYCDYFATTMMVMLRAVGIPARVASGFAPGTLDAADNAFLVRENDAHSWTEVYFEGYGWIPFEPSASRPRPERRSDAHPLPGETREHEPGGQALADDRPGALEPGGQVERPGVTPISVVLLLVGGALLAAGSALGIGRWLWLRGLEHLPPRRRQYGELRRVAALARVPLEPSLTPTEVAARLGERFPERAAAIETIARRYERDTYGPPGRGQDAVDAGWPRLRRALVRAAVAARLRRGVRPRSRGD